MWTCGGLTLTHRHGPRWVSQLEVSSVCLLPVSRPQPCSVGRSSGHAEACAGPQGWQCAPKAKSTDAPCMAGLMVYDGRSVDPLAMPVSFLSSSSAHWKLRVQTLRQLAAAAQLGLLQSPLLCGCT